MWIQKILLLTFLRMAMAVCTCSAVPDDDQTNEPLLPADSANSANQQISANLTTPAPSEEIEIPEYLKSCFHTDASICETFNLSPNETGSPSGTFNIDCSCRPHSTIINSWYCCNIKNLAMISSCSNIINWTNLHIHNATIIDLELSNSVFQHLHSLAITGGNISRLVGSFSRVSPIKCLNISNNNISYISQRALSTPNLKFIDISQNNLTRIPKLNQNQNITVDIRGNKHMLCTDLLDTIFRDSIKFVDPKTSYCVMNNTYNWFNSTDYISIKELDLAFRFQTECPVIPGYGNCTCSREQMLIMGNQSKLFCHVDCSNLGLTELPPKLPENTFSLNISNNKIKSLGKTFQHNPTYYSIVKLYADNNEISQIDDLEGAKFIRQFQRLYLRNNALGRLPIFLFTMDTDVGRNIFLAGNKLYCDCQTAKELKSKLLERNRDITDYSEILCGNMPHRVIELQETKLCQSPHDWTDYIYYLIATEVILLIALITKVSYDYWVFKTAGYLPWPASKMPKLPCDWLCES